MPRRIPPILLTTGVLILGFHSPARAAQTTAGTPVPDLPRATGQVLANGIRVVHLPRPGSSGEAGTEISFGYVPADAGTDGARSPAGELFASYLSLSVPARSVALAAHLAGGEFELLDGPDRIGMRVRVPSGALTDVSRQIARYFAHAIVSFEVLEYVQSVSQQTASGAPSGPIEEIRGEVEAVLFDRPPPGLGEDAESAGLPEVQEYLDTYIGTDRAYVISSDPLPPEAVALLGAVALRGSLYEPAPEEAGSAEVELRFPSQPEGGVILATAIPSPRYESWFSALVVDQVLRRSAGPGVRMDFRVEPRQSMHRIQAVVRLPDYPEDVRDEWIGRIQSVLFEPVPEAELAGIKADVMGRLAEPSMLEWFVAHNLWDALTVGWEMLSGLTPDGLRSRALAFAGARRVVAVWSPLFEQPAAVVEDLAAASVAPEPAGEPETRPVPGNVAVGPVTAVDAAEPASIELDRLESGITLAPNERHMIFIAGEFSGTLTGGEVLKSGTGGTLFGFAAAPSDEVVRQLDDVRADRLLLFYPPFELGGARARFETWAGGAADDSPSLALGEVATADLPGLVILKTWLESKLIEAGWWGRVRLRIDGVEGSRLVAEGETELAGIVRSWIAELAGTGIVESEFVRVRNAAAGQFERLRRELQIILWQRAPDGAIPAPASFPLARLRDIAGTYFDYSD